MNNKDYIEVTIDLTKEEEKLIVELAKKEGKTLEKFINDTLFEYIKKEEFKVSNPYQDRVEITKSLFGIISDEMILEEAREERMSKT